VFLNVHWRVGVDTKERKSAAEPDHNPLEAKKNDYTQHTSTDGSGKWGNPKPEGGLGARGVMNITKSGLFSHKRIE